MKLNDTILGLVIVLTLLTSCKDDDLANLPTNDKVIFSANISTALTRASSSTWESNDAIGIYALSTGSTLSEEAIYNQKENIKYLTNSAGATGKLTPANENQAIRFPRNGDSIDFIAYYPYTTNISEFKIPINISNQSDISAIDLLYTRKNEQNKANPNVQLEFSHQLSRVIIELSKEGNIDLTDANVILKEALVKGFFDLKNGTVTQGSETANITAYKNGNTATTILIPGQEISNITIQIILKDGSTYEWTSAQYLLKAGKSITYSLLLNEKEIKAETSATIQDWEIETGQNASLFPKKDTPSSNLLFPGSNFEDWTAFKASLNSKGLKYGEQSNEGRNGTKALHINKNLSSYTEIFTVKVPNNFTVPNKISLYIRGSSTGTKSAVFYFMTTDGKKRCFNLKNLSSDTIISTPTQNPSYNGTINTNNKWVKVSFELSTIKDIIPTTLDDDLLVFKIGKSDYDLYIDDIIIE